MKIKLNPETYGHEKHIGTHCEWVLTKIDPNYNMRYNFEPLEELPTFGRPGSTQQIIAMCFGEDEFQEKIENGDIIVVEKDNIRYSKKKCEFK